nr:MAG TPA: hypothetical protein [Bacteriophage sp.]
MSSLSVRMSYSFFLFISSDTLRHIKRKKS